MTLYEPPNLTAGIDEAIVGTIVAVPSFLPMMLLFVFGVVFIGGVTSQKRRTGSADFPMWATLSSVATLMVTLPLTLTEGLIQLEVLVTVVALTIASGLWLFLTRHRHEV